MNKLLIFNMKMYMDINDVKNYLTQLKSFPNNVIICPEMIYLPYFLKYHNQIALQNIHHVNDGAFTGEVSARHAKCMNVDYTVIGHSERRLWFNETDTGINAKIKTALDSGLKVILCIGETLEDYEKKVTKEKLLSQIIIDLFDNNQFNEDNLIIAYEPVWAIGTGKIPTNDEIIETISFIKETIKEKYDKMVKVVYGGSVNSKNISSLNDIDIIDGFMIGGSSTKVDEVRCMLEVVNK